MLRLLGRLAVLALAGALVVVVGLQYARVIGKTVAMHDEYVMAQNDVRALEVQRAEAERHIARLSSPAGAIPEIHDKLHLVGDHEAIIYLKKHGAGP